MDNGILMNGFILSDSSGANYKLVFFSGVFQNNTCDYKLFILLDIVVCYLVLTKDDGRSDWNILKINQ